jgi:hypothetical protein
MRQVDPSGRSGKREFTTRSGRCRGLKEVSVPTAQVRMSIGIRPLLRGPASYQPAPQPKRSFPLVRPDLADLAHGACVRAAPRSSGAVHQGDERHPRGQSAQFAQGIQAVPERRDHVEPQRQEHGGEDPAQNQSPVQRKSPIGAAAPKCAGELSPKRAAHRGVPAKARRLPDSCDYLRRRRFPRGPRRPGQGTADSISCRPRPIANPER